MDVFVVSQAVGLKILVFEAQRMETILLRLSRFSGNGCFLSNGRQVCNCRLVELYVMETPKFLTVELMLKERKC